jgi:ribosomal protein S18 acetylase RimI-like enzyme
MNTKPSSSSVLIRRAQVADSAAIAPLFDAYRQFYQQAPDLAGAQSFIHARLSRQESVIFLAADSAGELLGFCQLYPSFCSVQAQPIYTLYDLFVSPNARRCGAGRALLQAAHDHAAREGYARMDLTTARDNHAAQALYESLGWIQDRVFLSYNLRMKG